MTDWEDSNKMAFVMMVNLYLMKTEGLDAFRCASILFEAMRVRKIHVPTNLPLALSEFTNWQLHNGEVPKWAVSQLPLLGGIAGL